MNDETNEQHEVQHDEAPKASESQWLEPSHVGGEFMRHAQAMEPAGRVPVYKAFAIGPGFNVGILRKMAESYKPKRIVVIEHGEAGCEIRRLGNNDDVSLFYASLEPAKLEVITATEDKQQVELVSKVVREFTANTVEEISKYDPRAVELRSAGCISYSYLQRRLAPVSLFRRDTRGSSEALKAVLSAMEGEGMLRRLEKEEASELFNTTAVVYRINKGSF